MPVVDLTAHVGHPVAVHDRGTRSSRTRPGTFHPAASLHAGPLKRRRSRSPFESAHVIPRRAARADVGLAVAVDVRKLDGRRVRRDAPPGRVAPPGARDVGAEAGAGGERAVESVRRATAHVGLAVAVDVREADRAVAARRVPSRGVAPRRARERSAEAGPGRERARDPRGCPRADVGLAVAVHVGKLDRRVVLREVPPPPTPASSRRRSTRAPRTGYRSAVPVERAHVIPAAARPQTSDMPSPFTSANCTVDAYAAGCHRSRRSTPGPRTARRSRCPSRARRPRRSGSRPQASASPVAVHVGAARALRPRPPEELVDRPDHLVDVDLPGDPGERAVVVVLPDRRLGPRRGGGEAGRARVVGYPERVGIEAGGVDVGARARGARAREEAHVRVDDRLSPGRGLDRVQPGEHVRAKGRPRSSTPVPPLKPRQSSVGPVGHSTSSIGDEVLGVEGAHRGEEVVRLRDPIHGRIEEVVRAADDARGLRRRPVQRERRSRRRSSPGSPS